MLLPCTSESTNGHGNESEFLALYFTPPPCCMQDRVVIVSMHRTTCSGSQLRQAGWTDFVTSTSDIGGKLLKDVIKFSRSASVDSQTQK